MKIIYIDESGNSYNWKNDYETQPFYVLSATSFDLSCYENTCKQLRDEYLTIFPHNPNDETHQKVLGLGHELKAKEVLTNQGWWKNNQKKRESIINLMFNFPEQAWLVIVDKKKHFEQYIDPREPLELCLQFLFERIQHYLIEENERAICIFDQNKRVDDTIHECSIDLIKSGSAFLDYHMNSYKFAIDRILECHLGNSKNSLGLLSADYFATGAYQYYKQNKPTNCTWWNLLVKKLYCKNGELIGYGLKEFPKI